MPNNRTLRVALALLLIASGTVTVYWSVGGTGALAPPGAAEETRSGTGPTQSTPTGTGTPVATPVASERSPFDVETSLDATRFPRTLGLVENSRTPSGGYTPFPPREPTLYSTHYAYRTASAVDWNGTGDDATAAWLRTALADQFRPESPLTFASTDRSLNVRDYYFAVTTLRAVDGSGPDPDAVVRTLERFRRPDGSYCDSVYRVNGTCTDDVDALLSTYYAVATLDALEEPVPGETRAWLRDYWLDDANFRGASSFPAVDKALRALEAAGEDPAALPNYGQRRAWAAEAAPTAGSLADRDRLDLVVLHSAVSVTRRLDVDPPLSPDELATLIGGRQLPDGGFSIVGSDSSDMKGTSLATSLVADRPGAIDREAVGDLLAGHRLETGGFAPVYRSRPSLAASYYAVEIQSLFGRDAAADPDLAAWVAGTPADSVPLEVVYHAAALADAADAEGPSRAATVRRLETFFEGAGAERTWDLRRLHYAVELATLVSYDYDQRAVRRSVLARQHDDGGFGTHESRTDATFYAVSVLDRTGGVPAPVGQRVLEWVDSGRIDGSGYAFRVGERRTARAYTYATFANVAIHALLDDPVEDPSAVRASLAAARHPDGGFLLASPIDGERQTVSVASTYYALKAIQLLDAQALAGSRSPAG